MPNQVTLDLLEDANKAIFKAEQAIRLEEGASVNRPMYRMRIGLNDLIRQYMANQKICESETNHERMMRLVGQS